MSKSVSVPYAEPLWLNRGTSPYYNDTHRQLQQEVRQYVDTHLLPFAEQWESAGEVPRQVIAEHSRLGYQAAAVYPLAKAQLNGQRLPGNVDPERWDAFHDLVVIDEIARIGYLGVIWALTCGNSIGAPPLVVYGSEEQKRKYLPSVLNGSSRFCLAVTEPDAGSDVAGITTTAERRGDKYIVNGAKKWITNGMFADYCTAAVRTGGAGKDGVSALIIPLNAPGVTRKKISNSGVYSSASTYIEFDEVEVPAENLLGPENGGFGIIMSNFNHERLWLGATSLRLARCCIEDAYRYAAVRETFGKRLLENQMIRSKFSASGRKVESAHALMEQLVYLNSEALRRGGDAHLGGQFANFKVLAAQTLEFVTREAQQTMGGLGYSRGGRGGRVEQISRDVRVMVVGGGSEEILADLAVVQEVRSLSKLRKKTRCPGERPACAFCVRLGQTCRYADSASANPFHPQPPAVHVTRSPSSSAAVVSLPPPPASTFSHLRPSPHPCATSGPSTSENADTPRFKQPPSPHVISKLTDVYFSNCHNQPYCFFHEANMRRRLQDGEVPEPLLLAFAASAARYSRDDYFQPDALVAVESYARDAWAMLKCQVLDSDSCGDLAAVQATTLLAIIDFTAGQHRQGWVKIGLAIRLMQDLKLNTEPDPDAPNWQQEEYRRVFWSVYLLDRFFACGNARPVSILDSDCTVRLPCHEEAFRLGSRVSDTPTLAILLAPWQAKLDSLRLLDSFAIMILMTSLLGRTVRYEALDDSPTVPCWVMGSEFADIASLLMSFESTHELGAQDLSQHVNALFGTYEGFDRQRVGHFVWARALYHLCGAILYRPSHIYKHRRRWQGTFPLSFARDALDRCQRHTAHLTDILRTVQSTGCCARGSSLGYVASCAASMHKIFLHSSDDFVALKAADGVDTCLKFLQQSPVTWPNYHLMSQTVTEFNVEAGLARRLLDPILPATVEIEKQQLERLRMVLDYAWLSDASRMNTIAA
ncbi:hypothetical protein CERZMDRAFT_23816, partial [Cercospora zeae-maydis SCOH1-5]